VESGKFDLQGEEPERVEMLMTSMIDVIFILLAFFVCVTELKKGHLDVDVPQVPTAAPAKEEAPDPVIVDVTAENEIYVDSELAEDGPTLDRLLAKLVAERGDPDEVVVHLAGDRDAKNGTMMVVVSHLSRAGIKRIEFAVQGGG
jgi:biopolymer transport protein ExbD